MFKVSELKFFLKKGKLEVVGAEVEFSSAGVGGIGSTTVGVASQGYCS